jgi:hypothetical protein
MNKNKQPRAKPNWLFIFYFLIKAYNYEGINNPIRAASANYQLDEGHALIV